MCSSSKDTYVLKVQEGIIEKRRKKEKKLKFEHIFTDYSFTVLNTFSLKSKLCFRQSVDSEVNTGLRTWIIMN